MKTCLLFLLWFGVLNFCPLHSQSFRKQSLLFKPVFGISDLRLDSLYYPVHDKDSLQFETLKWYISGIEFLINGKSVWREENSFHLLNAADSSTLHIDLNIPSDLKFNHIRFKLGIDSLTNVSGALGGDLDPTKGMYWTWQSGYINLKAEGKSNQCQTRNNEFQFHLGGYAAPFNTLQTLVLAVNPKHAITVHFDLQEWFSSIDLHQLNHIMSPGADAVKLSNQLLNCFSVRMQ